MLFTLPNAVCNARRGRVDLPEEDKHVWDRL
jgi:hypothetical protein